MQYLAFKLSSYLLVAVVAVLLCGCGKNEFTFSGTLKDAGSRNLTVIYTALSDSHDELVTQRVPCNAGQFSLVGATRYPTLVWILAADGKMLHLFYVEKGDKLEITGDYNSPLEWRANGNDASEHYCEWMAKNVQLLTADDPAKVNAAIAGYVKEHPDDRASALLLLSFYHRNTDEVGFRKLWDMLDISDKDKERLLHVAMTQLDDTQQKAAAVAVTPVSLRARGDSTVTISPAASRATILYFWRRSDGPHQGTLRVLASQPEDVQVADVFMDPDTVQWRYMTQNDTIRRRKALWAFGGEMNLSLRRLAIPSAPYIIVADRKGKQIYRGVSPSDASAAAAKAK